MAIMLTRLNFADILVRVHMLHFYIIIISRATCGE